MMKLCSGREHNFKNSSASAEIVLPGIPPKLETVKFEAPGKSGPEYEKKYQRF